MLLAPALRSASVGLSRSFRNRLLSGLSVATVALASILSGPTPVTAQASPTISGVTAVPDAFNSETGATTLSYTLSNVTGAQIQLEIYDFGGSLVRSVAAGTQGSGAHTIVWDGKDGAGQAVSDGTYTARVIASATGSAGSSGYGYVAKWGTRGVSDGQFEDPQGVTTDASGNVYVADYVNRNIQKFDSSGNFLARWGSDGQFQSLESLAVDSAGNIYVTDSFNNRVLKFDSDGHLNGTWGSPGVMNGQFMIPRGIAVDSKGNVYVADSFNHRIQKFDAGGKFLAGWGRTGSLPTEFQQPWGLATDSSDNLYVADSINSRIQKFDANGRFLAQWGSWGAGDGQLFWPRGVSVDSSGAVYVTDALNPRVQKFDATGKFLTKWGSNGSGDGQLLGSGGVNVGPDGAVYVADSGNHRIQKFAQSSSLTTISAETLVLVDNTPPTVAYSGNAVTYTVDQRVDITCTAEDTGAGAGLESSTCVDISGPAYTFNPGENTYSAEAVDRAGNLGSGATSFTVTVTPEGLYGLIDQFVTKKGIATSLKAKLQNAAAADAKGNGEAKAGLIVAFTDEVKAQIGKAITPEHAEILIRLAKGL